MVEREKVSERGIARETNGRTDREKDRAKRESVSAATIAQYPRSCIDFCSIVKEIN